LSEYSLRWIKAHRYEKAPAFNRRLPGHAAELQRLGRVITEKLPVIYEEASGRQLPRQALQNNRERAIF
jgi:hypothetical protein